MDLVSGQGVNPEAMLAGADRSLQQLALAASIEAATYDAGTGRLSFRVRNHTGHKLISGYPEGRRLFVNVRAYQAETLVYEINPYDTAAATLKGLDGFAYPPPAGDDPPLPGALGAGEAYVDDLVYEAQMASSLTGEEHTFHFALATSRYKDNRIPPKGFRISEASARLATPVSQGQPDTGLYTAAEYAGGYDEVTVDLPSGADRIEIGLYYQTTSREYVTFLAQEINGENGTLPDPGAYIAQTDAFFTALRGWGDTIWQLWKHNRELPGAAPVLMAAATVGGGGAGCTASRGPGLERRAFRGSVGQRLRRVLRPGRQGPVRRHARPGDRLRG
jgi:hypothetical protein